MDKLKIILPINEKSLFLKESFFDVSGIWSEMRVKAEISYLTESWLYKILLHKWPLLIKEQYYKVTDTTFSIEDFFVQDTIEDLMMDVDIDILFNGAYDWCSRYAFVDETDEDNDLFFDCY